MDVPASPSEVLAQPTRARLFSLLVELRRAASTEELADRLGMHPNGVRTHLDRLQQAGLVDREQERIPLGRPRDSWAVSPDAQPSGTAPTAYADLGRWLVRSMTAAKIGVREIEAIGRTIGRELAPQDSTASSERRMHDVLTTLGFQPQRERDSADRLTFRLGNCPYREVVPERQPMVCGLHRGITRGLLDAIDPTTKLTGFVPLDPSTAGCLIHLRGGLAVAPPENSSGETPTS